MADLFLKVGIIKNKPIFTHYYIVTCSKYDNGKIIETKNTSINIYTSFNYNSARKYAISATLHKLNKYPIEFVKNIFQYISIS
jgi:hypothetical protein